MDPSSSNWITRRKPNSHGFTKQGDFSNRTVVHDFWFLSGVWHGLHTKQVQNSHGWKYTTKETVGPAFSTCLFSILLIVGYFIWDKLQLWSANWWLPFRANHHELASTSAGLQISSHYMASLKEKLKYPMNVLVNDPSPPRRKVVQFCTQTLFVW